VAHPFFAAPGPLVIGHRGCAGEAPENTLASFARALAQGAHVLESDLQLTRDGVPVLLHDEDLGRTTDGRGSVARLDLAELRRLDAGHRFSPDGGASFPFRGRGLRVPSLEEAFAAFPEARFNLELKQSAPLLAERAVALVLRAGREDRTLLTAGDDAAMAGLRAELARRGARVAQGASPADVLELLRSAAERRAPRSPAMAYQVPPEFEGRPLVTAEMVAHAHAHGAQVHVWTVNDPAEMERLLDLGADGLVTDFPGRLAALLARRAARPPAPGPPGSSRRVES
jgi:glycerophosphoryl diester phosphodiesterase